MIRSSDEQMPGTGVLSQCLSWTSEWHFAYRHAVEVGDDVLSIPANCIMAPLVCSRTFHAIKSYRGAISLPDISEQVVMSRFTKIEPEEQGMSAPVSIRQQVPRKVIL